MLAYCGVEKEYVAGTKVVKSFDLSIEKGETVALVGSSGCGKTTVLRMANRLEESTGGRVFFKDVDVQDIDQVLLRRQIGYVIQQVGLFPHMTVGENISFVLRLHSWDKQKIRNRVLEMLEMVGLPFSVEKIRPSHLSGGQQQRVGVARAMAAMPDLLLMDEPFGALDPITRNQIQNQMIGIKKAFKTSILLVTHDIQEAFRLGDRIVIMKDGCIVQSGAPKEVLCFPANEYVQEFINGAFDYANVVNEFRENCQKKSGDISEPTI